MVSHHAKLHMSLFWPKVCNDATDKVVFTLLEHIVDKRLLPLFAVQLLNSSRGRLLLLCMTHALFHSNPKHAYTVAR